ncbi:hypothetical protein PTKIN_Ptkin02bG0259800 [Pterospermum kingtungense]
MGHHCCNKQKVKRGLWSPEEDEKLVKYITNHGHASWSSVPKLAGLQRCGKSCRLRWINYLRPDLKRGSFSAQEEKIIIDVHRMLGNRWAQIAKHLPGRTDNEVKNFWNSCIKKKLIAQGLDPNTHNYLLPYKPINIGSNHGKSGSAKLISPCMDQLQRATFSNLSSSLGNYCYSFDTKPPPFFISSSTTPPASSVPLPTPPPTIDNYSHSFSLHEEVSALATCEDQKCNMVRTIKEQNWHASKEPSCSLWESVLPLISSSSYEYHQPASAGPAENEAVIMYRQQQLVGSRNPAQQRQRICELGIDGQRNAEQNLEMEVGFEFEKFDVAELPGLYYDAEKNRYFPIKPRIPGSSSLASQSQKNPPSTSIQETKLGPQTRASTSRLLHFRELNGNAFNFNRGRLSFQEEFHKLQASKPVVWRYRGTYNLSDSALEHTQVDVQTLEGQMETDILLEGSIDGSLSFLKVEKFGQHLDCGVTYIPDHIWPSTKVKAQSNKTPQYMWKPPGASLQMSSRISCIRLSEKQSLFTSNDDSKDKHALITTLGSETSGGYVYILNLQEPVDFTSRLEQRLHAVASFNYTIWTADYNSHTRRAVIGTNLGAALVNVERGTSTWVCRSKSDVLAQQFDQTGNLVFCGLRNGAIITVDVRENQESISGRLSRHRLPYSSSGRSNQKQRFELRGYISPSHTIYMPSSISSLVSLQSYDQYLLASSMDGSVSFFYPFKSCINFFFCT